MSTIIFTAGAKGGTGKSTAARFVITYLREHGLNPMLMDMDNESKTLSRFFPEARQIEIMKSSSHDVLLENIVSGNDLIVADLKAGTGRDILNWWLDVPFSELPNVRFICLAAITSSPDSVQSFLNWVGALQNRVSYVVFKNQKDGEMFYDYEGSTQAINFQRIFRPYHVLIPHIDPEYVVELERQNLTVDEILDPTDGKSSKGRDIGPILSKLMVRSRLRRLQREIYQQLDAIPELLKQ